MNAFDTLIGVKRNNADFTRIFCVTKIKRHFEVATKDIKKEVLLIFFEMFVAAKWHDK